MQYANQAGVSGVGGKVVLGGALTGEEATLVEKIVGGPDMRAFEVVVQRYSGMVLATCRRVMDSASDAEDATQETFLKLLQQAGTIKHHLGAWLHQCAVRTCIDMRRRMKTQAQHVKQASLQGAAGGGEQVTAREMMAEVDQAMLELDQESRDLILTRYLLGRTLKELAEASGVSEGTMSRRVEKATESLREIMAKRGVMAGGVGGGAASMAPMTAMLEGCGPVAVDPIMQASLMKLGLSAGGQVGGSAGAGSGGGSGGAAASGASASFWSGGTFIGIAAGIAVLTGAAVMYNLSSGSAGGSVLDAAIAPTAGVTVAPGRPTKELEPLDLAQAWGDTGMGGRLQISGNKIRFTHPVQDQDDAIALEAEVVKAQTYKESTRLTLLTKQLLSTDGTGFRTEVIEKPVEGMITVRGGRMTLEMRSPDRVATVNDPSQWIDKRIAAVRGEAPKAGEPKRQPMAESTPSGAAEALAPFAGWWDQVEEWKLILSENEIRVLVPSIDLYKFRILDWQIEGDVAKVQTICTRSVFQHMPGQRVKMLLQVKAERLRMSVHEAKTGKLNEWPSGFDSAKDPSVVVYSWGKELIK